MERPPSQMENTRPSGLKPPSRLPAMSNSVGGGRTLLETSQSDLNAKSVGAGSMMPPPSMTGSVKHKISGLPEPPTKRKTLAERAGEPLNPLRSHSQMPQPTKPTSHHTRTQSNTTSMGYRNPSVASTTSSNGNRPPSRQMGSRPPCVVDTRNGVEEDDAGVTGKRKGTPPLSFNIQDGLRLHKTRTQQDLRQPSANMSMPRSQHSAGSHVLHALSSSSVSSASSVHATFRTASDGSNTSSTSLQQGANQSQPCSRNVSLCNQFELLSLTPPTRKTTGPKSSTTKHRPSLSPVKEDLSPSKIPKFSCTPSLRHAQSSQAVLSTPSPLKQKASLVSGPRTPVTSAVRARDELPIFLTKEKLTSLPAWDTKGRLEDMEQSFLKLRSQFADAAESKDAIEETLKLYKTQVHELSQQNKELSSTNRHLTSDLDRARNDLHATTSDLKQARRDHERDTQNAERDHKRDLDELYMKQEQESHRFERELEKIASQGERDMEESRRAWEKQKDDETAEMTTQHWEELEDLRTKHQREMERLQGLIDELERSGESRAEESVAEVQGLRDSIEGLNDQLESLKLATSTLRSQLSAAESRNASIEAEKTALISKAHFLEGNQEAQSHEFTTMSEKLQDAINSRESTLERLRQEEMLRRKLNATILELRGNIRVFVRTRPLLAGEEEPAKVEYPDADALDGNKELVVHAPVTLSATGKERNEKHQYAFDRIFGPQAPNDSVFEETRELIQSVVDGYNVSILSYGQTGSGKTFGMSGPDGIIPSSISMLLTEMSRLREKGWEYAVEASFVEVYNETLNDLLGDAKHWDDTNGEDLSASVRGKKKEKHEIRHDPITGKTTVANLSSVTLWPPPQNEGSWPPPAPAPAASSSSSYTEAAVTRLLDTAAKNRRVAATNSNSRSSRSHSIFILTLKGSCAATSESSEGVLNLVDLAGSERLKASGAEGNRMKETQAINKSLSSLGDVIAALGNKKGGDESHVPYRNSKLTYLLQSSLGGTHSATGKSSRTLMLLHLSPLMAHWQESRSSLLFGSKVHGTIIGKAKQK